MSTNKCTVLELYSSASDFKRKKKEDPLPPPPQKKIQRKRQQQQRQTNNKESTKWPDENITSKQNKNRGYRQQAIVYLQLYNNNFMWFWERETYILNN